MSDMAAEGKIVAVVSITMILLPVLFIKNKSGYYEREKLSPI